MSKLSGTLFAACLALSCSAQAEERRELGAHEHGHGTLDVAVEGNIVKLELHAPGDDVVGFEHAPSTPEQTKSLAAAKVALGNPLELFQPSPEAKCTVQSAEVSIRKEEHDEHDEHDHDDKTDKKDGAEAEHNEFAVEYSLKCADVSKLTSMTMGYFESFKNAQKLTVQVITSQGQSKFEASREQPKVSFGNLM